MSRSIYYWFLKISVHACTLPRLEQTIWNARWVVLRFITIDYPREERASTPLLAGQLPGMRSECRSLHTAAVERGRATTQRHSAPTQGHRAAVQRHSVQLMGEEQKQEADQFLVKSWQYLGKQQFLCVQF